AVLSLRAPTLSLDVPASLPASAAPAGGSAPAPSGAPPLQRGALHILGRHETPVFLLALFASSSALRAALTTALVFVAAAAVGLVLGARGIFMPSPRALALAIAASLVYAGLDAIVTGASPSIPGPTATMLSTGAPSGSARWSVALPFGVVHGL